MINGTLNPTVAACYQPYSPEMHPGTADCRVVTCQRNQCHISIQTLHFYSAEGFDSKRWNGNQPPPAPLHHHHRPQGGGRGTSRLRSKVFISANQAAQARFSHPTLTSLTKLFNLPTPVLLNVSPPTALLHKLTNRLAHKTLMVCVYLCKVFKWNKKKMNRGAQSQRTSMYMVSALNFAYTIGPNHMCI